MAGKEEQRDIQNRSAPTGAVVYKTIRAEGEHELERATAALAWSGLAAGLSMGFSFATEAMLRAALPDTPWRPLVAKLGYSVGFLIVVLGRQQLFTENTLTVVLPVLRRRDSLMFGNVARLWATVLIANLAGALVFAWSSAHTDIFSPETKRAMSSIGLDALSPPFLTVFLRGIVAGWLIALMVWLLPFAESARVWVIVIITYVVGIGQFSHVIAGSVEVFTAAAMGEAEWGRVVGGYVLPTLVGNVIGGVALVACLNHAQVVAGGGG